MADCEAQAVRLAEVDARSRSNTKRIDELQRKQDDLGELVSCISTLKNEQDHIKTDVGEIKADVKEMKGKPAKRWDSLIDKAIWAVAAALITYILTNIGL